jgi:hypothetical protein
MNLINHKENITIMKQIKSLLLISFLVLIGFSAVGQASMTFRFNNFMVVPGATNDTLIFDVEAKSDVSTTYLTQMGIVISFSEAAFGANALPVDAEQLELTSPSGYNLNSLAVPGGASNRFASTFAAFPLIAPFSGTYDIAFLSNVTTEFQGAIRYKMLITGTGDLEIAFYEPSMNGQQFYVLTSGGTSATAYTPIIYGDTINVPPTPTVFDLMFSEFADPSNSSANFVEIYNAGDYDVSFDSYPWFLTVDAGGISSVQLTGSIGSGESYVVAHMASNFNTAYPGKTFDLESSIIGTDGGWDYFLSIFGEYNDGMSIDEYSSDFDGKHAVRFYDVMAPNTMFDGTEWSISAAENIDMTPGSHRMDLTWDGSSDSEWRDTANWTMPYVPDVGHNATIPNIGETVPMISYGDNGFANDLSIGGSGVGLVIASESGVGDGSLITYGTVSGTASVQRYLGADRFWYVTQPVTSALAGVFLHTWLYTYDETIGNWTEWIVPEATPLNLMQGYAVWTSSVNTWDPDLPPIGDTTVAYDGTLNTGAQSVGLTFTANGATYGDGWNFVGNPYPSAADWEATGWTKTGLVTNAYSVWDGATYGTYTVGSGGTNGATQFIPAAQGFFVQTNAAGTLGMDNDVRTHSTQAFWKNEENMLNRLSLTISNGETSDETIIYFNEEATSELDYDYDATKLMAPAAPQAFTMLDETRMAINTFNNTGETSAVTMGINAPESGQYTINASNIESFDAAIAIILEDLVESKFTNLREETSYTFENEDGITERFIIHFTDTQGIDDPASAEVSNIYSYDKEVYVNFEGTRGEISIYNILGQEISRTVATNGLNVLSVPQGNAVYIVKVLTDNVNVTKKVFVK